jgi:hypothetical protein
LRDREQTAQDDEEGDDPGEDRPVDEEASHGSAHLRHGLG